MVTIKNFESSRNMPETFGYISIGTLEDTEEDINKNSWCLMDIKAFLATCEIDGKEFKLIIPKVGIYSLYTILGDLTQIPIDLVADNSEIKKAILGEIRKYMDKTFKTTQYYDRSYVDVDTITSIDNSAKNTIYSPGSSVFYNNTYNKDSITSVSSGVWDKCYNEVTKYFNKCD